MVLFDSHAHYYDDKFGEEAERQEVIARIGKAGVAYVLNAGTNPDTSLLSLTLAHRNKGFFASVGVHPEDLFDLTEDRKTVLRKIRSLASDEKAVAIGEIGLDYHFYEDPADRALQKLWFEEQLALAGELSLPVIVHDREAHGDCLSLVSRYPGVRGVFHSYSGSKETAMELLKLGWYISFSGVITFRNAVKCAEVVPAIPHDRILIETDCPYLAPHPCRGQRNDSSLMLHTLMKAAELRGVSPESLAADTLRNTAALFSKCNISI